MKAIKGFFDWGLNLPEKAVSRRVSKRCEVNKLENLASLPGPGCITRLWVTGTNIGRELILRIYFDGSETAHIEAPLADFFGVMHNLSERHSKYWEENKDRAAYPLNTPFLSSKPHNGFTAYFPMPFSSSARIEIENDSGRKSGVYCIIDWHAYPNAKLEENMRFCARWRREAPARDYQDDFLILDAGGPGRLVGFVHSIDMLHDRDIMRWSHAGSDNVYLDGAGPYPAFLRGIGGEDTFGTSYGGHTYRPQSALFSDLPYYRQKNPGNDDRQKLVGYRFFAHDAICFDRSIHFRFGARAHDLATTVYWYSAAPLRPYTRMPPYRERIPGSKPRRNFDLPLEDSGNWWITGPFPESFEVAIPTDNKINPTRHFHDRLWRHYRAKRGFVEFNHVFRPVPSNQNSATLVDTKAIARCRLIVSEATSATLTFGWDDRLSYRLNNNSEVVLGENDFFDATSVQVKLRKGVNELGVALTNKTGLSAGGWCFSFGAITADGLELTPNIECSLAQTRNKGPLLAINFGAGTAAAGPEGFIPFAPAYSNDLSGAQASDCIDLTSSPQTLLLPTSSGPVEVTVAASDNTSLGFRQRNPVRQGPCLEQSEILRGEARANPSPQAEPVSLALSLTGLPKGEYSATSTHHCLDQNITLSPIRITVNGIPAFAGTEPQSAGLNPETVCKIRFPVNVPEAGNPVLIIFASTGTVILNSIEITKSTHAPAHDK